MTDLLLDTHVWLRLESAPEQIGSRAKRTLASPGNQLWLSAASAWEIAVKWSLGKLSLPMPPQEYVPSRMERSGIRPLPFTAAHALAVCELPDLHRDPFDRMLVAQARCEGMRLVTADRHVLRYPTDLVDARR